MEESGVGGGSGLGGVAQAIYGLALFLLVTWAACDIAGFGAK